MSKKQLRILFIALPITALFFGAFAFVVVHAGLSRVQLSPVSTTTPTGRGPIQNLRFTVYDAGIFPRQLRGKPGVVAIVLEDRTHKRPGVVIQRETGGGSLVVSEISFPLNQSRTRNELRLGAGQYQVVDVTNPANRAELIVQP